MTGKRILSCILSVVLLVSSCVIGISAAGDSGTSAFASQAAAYKKEWESKGNDGKTTLFIGDSFMSPQMWPEFYDTYIGKDVLRAGICSTTSYDWEVFTTDYLAYTNPKNIVMHIGTNNIYDDKANTDDTYAALTSMFEDIHTTLADTNIYYFGIPQRKNTTYADIVSAVNSKMETWCKDKGWITYIDTSAITTDDLKDGVHLKPEKYSILVDALAQTNIVLEDIKKNIDIYLIAGQSNAAGFSTYDSSVLSALDERYVNGFEHIYYSGAVAQLGAMDSSLREFSVQNVKAGMGITEDTIGPEIGMAENLSSLYNEETGAYAGFIKYAVGGSSLLNDLTNSANETWTSPSYKKSLTTEVTDGTNTGVLYDNFLSEVEKRLQEYEEAGFNPTIRGMYWMQGEADRRRESEYINAFENFASDVRNDLTEISGQNLTEMPIMVGEISKTFYAYKENTLNANNEFLATQRMLPSLVSECYLIKNSEYDITAYDPENPDSEKGIILGSDHAHWNYKDCIAIGNLVGEQIQEFDSVQPGDINGDAMVDNTDLSRLRYMLLRNVEDSSCLIAPEVYVSYDSGHVFNGGQNGKITVETCKFDNNSKPTTFVNTDSVTYTTGREGDVDGAIITNHYSGPYTVVRDYEFGKDDFTVSAWFNVPEEASISAGSATYIMGIEQPDGTTGFSATLKEGQIRFRSMATTRFLDVSYERDVWYNLAISREENVLKVFLDGNLLYTESVPVGYDFGTTDLGVGAYAGFSSAYKLAEMRFDDVQIYSLALGKEEINTISNCSVLVPKRNDVNEDEVCSVKDLVALKRAVAEYKSITSFDVAAADVEVNFNNGVVKNSGTNANITAGTYVLGGFETVVVNGQEKQKATRFDPTDNVSYTRGRDGAEKGAILTNNRNGAYMVIDNVNLGKEDFAVSTWFNVPEGETIGTGNGCYLLGTTNADDTTNGFRVTLRNTDVGIRLAYKAGTNDQEYHTLANFEHGEWHHIAVSRIGNALFLYYDGELAKIQIIGEDFDFGNSKIAFGAYPGVTWKYDDTDVAYDDVCFYQEEVTVSAIREIYGIEDVPGGDEGGDTGDDTTDTTTAKVKVTFDGGKVANSGTDTSITAETCVIDTTLTDPFKPTDAVNYTTGRDGSTNGAIVINHKNGPYTVIRDYNFGTGDFTVSTWISSQKVSGLGNNSGCYLFGTNHPDTGNGFSLCLKSVSGAYKIRVRATTDSATNASKDYPVPNVAVENNVWHNVTAARVGSVINIYFDGQLVGEHTVNNYNFGTKDLAFGAYHGFTNYFDMETHFDDIEVYGEGLSASQIQEKIMGKEPAKVRVTFDNGTVTNSGTDTSITAGAFVMDALTNATKFEATNSVSYTTGRGGDANGAINTNHRTGPYTVVENYNFGTGDFTVSTWFNVADISTLGNNSGCYLFGTVHPDSGKGFSACIKKNASGKYEIRVRAALQSSQFFEIPDVASNTWYNLTITRVGTTLNVYFDGSSVGTYTVNEYDFGTNNLAFGAYYEFGNTYNNANTYFDDVEVYATALTP